MKNKHLIYLIVISVMASSCATTIPPRDTVDPAFVFKISGDGLNENITPTFDFDNKALYLRRGAMYNIVLTVTDRGGLHQASWELPGPHILRLNDRNGWLVANSGDPYRDKYQFTGFRESPVNGASLTVRRMEAIGGPPSGEIINYEFVFSGTDFHDNTIQKILIIRITNEASRIGSRD
ncbi:MAG: hypothetical protein DWP94_05820 [Flavobacterium sp.]|nr:MAG: hypothetical protein DWP94_05820 [Flavobacterium sp.]